MEEKYVVLENVINALCTVRVSGEADMNSLLGSIQTLRKLVQLLKKEDAYNEGRVEGLMKKMEEVQDDTDSEALE